MSFRATGELLPDFEQLEILAFISSPFFVNIMKKIRKYSVVSDNMICGGSRCAKLTFFSLRAEIKDSRKFKTKRRVAVFLSFIEAGISGKSVHFYSLFSHVSGKSHFEKIQVSQITFCC